MCVCVGWGGLRGGGWGAQRGEAEGPGIPGRRERAYPSEAGPVHLQVHFACRLALTACCGGDAPATGPCLGGWAAAGSAGKVAIRRCACRRYSCLHHSLPPSNLTPTPTPCTPRSTACILPSASSPPPTFTAATSRTAPTWPQTRSAPGTPPPPSSPSCLSTSRERWARRCTGPGAARAVQDGCLEWPAGQGDAATCWRPLVVPAHSPTPPPTPAPQAQETVPEGSSSLVNEKEAEMVLQVGGRSAACVLHAASSGHGALCSLLVARDSGSLAQAAPPVRCASLPPTAFPPACHFRGPQMYRELRHRHSSLVGAKPSVAVISPYKAQVGGATCRNACAIVDWLALASLALC